MFYLTPDQARRMELGVDLTDVTDAQLSMFIRRATAAVNAATLAPDLPVPHDYRGGTVTGETHTWMIDPYERDVRRRVFPYHRPLLTVTSCRIYATLDQYLELDETQIYYETSEGWIEPASANMTSYGLFGAAMLPYIGLSHPHVSLDYTYGHRIPITEPMDEDGVVDDVWWASSGWWVGAPVVKIDEVVRSTNLTLDPIEGTVTFTAAPLPTSANLVTIEYVTSLHPNIALATGLTVADRVISKNLSTAGLAGLKSFRIAEGMVTLADGGAGLATSSNAMYRVPDEAMDFLAEFIHTPLAFG